MAKQINIGIIGVGTIGSAVVLLLESNREIIKARAGVEFVVKKGVVRDMSKTDKRVKIPLSHDINDVLDDESIDVVIELMGGVDVAFEVAKKALERKKAFITANKAMLAYHRYDLLALAKSPVCFEASVAGGIPIIMAMREGLSANHILSIRGILNGTCNYILNKMTSEGGDFAKCLSEAQTLGYAESDPTLDISGMDTAHKLVILASIAYGIKATPEEILVEGISEINQDDIFFANEFGYAIKLLAIAKIVGDEVELRVHPTMIGANEMISKVSGVMNGISVVGDKVGETMYYGAGAGGNPTASAVVGDLIQIARGCASSMLGFKEGFDGTLKLRQRAHIESRYYLRIKVADKAGVLARITKILGENDISIKMLIQRESHREGIATLLLSTHKSSEKQIQRALDALGKLEIICDKPYMMRIEE